MSFYNWDPKILSVRVEEMDQEHQVLINKMNALYDAHHHNKSKEEIEKLLNDFANYTIQHFEDEEKYMQKINFQGFEAHKVIHQRLRSEVNKYLDEFKKNEKLSQSFFNFLSAWLTSHIRGVDAKYGEFSLKKVG